MQHIDKNNPVSEAGIKAIVDPHLQTGEYRYDLLMPSERFALRQILSAEQNHRCCYCVRTIQQDDETIEHLIPKFVSRQGFGYAMRHMGGGLYKTDIIYGGIYTPAAVGFYYPHPLAYGNLVMACYECNEAKRGEDEKGFIRPLFFENPVSGISYNEKGKMTLVQNDSLPESLKIRLNEDTFMHIRSLWRAFKLSGVTVNNVNEARDEALRLSLLKQALPFIVTARVKDDIERRCGMRFTSDGTWGLIISFSWFWGYY